MTTIPCRRPRVVVVHDRHKDITGAHCQVYGCDWKYGPGVKTDVEQQATRHRGEHRAAVPDTAVLLRRGGGYQAECDCGWKAADGCLTRTDNERSLEHHLSTVHGLVS